MRLERARIAELRRSVGAFVVDGFFRGGSRLAMLHPDAKPERHGVEIERDVAYAETGAHHHLLDVYKPTKQAGPLPVVLYVHGGGFRILSKDSHWIMGLAFARRGYLVFVVNYRLAPKHRYPAALEDCADAYAWVVKNAARYGGDASRLVLAGESAGANLVTSMTIAACYERPEPYAKKIFDVGLVPQATLPACGIHQVTDVERFGRRKKLPAYLADRLHEVSSAYLPEGEDTPLDLADPLCVLERGESPSRALPPFFIACGTKDPLLDDTRRLGKALDALGVKNEVAIYPGEVHAFHAFVWRAQAKKCWRDTYRFLDAIVGPPADAGLSASSTSSRAP
ncbi:MAG TPA: alpha/beta hydrolase [Polyangiaceae bacterium]|jgi:acetyl esterase|nr:alpha/beta hydrolase [Polyangiaceae bacterium]